ncbi:MAG: glycoside hydrolase family 2 protein [Phreatobacter sp.]|uniref:glycosyl hydrolase 2 galactose-binding domain-containing protein n=1 Tax=Phreatobacter sp. TaxID=1966341 RepID=UPI0027374604|nr:glycoside hydrolase family 2 protein [Phreatobacter sp.]MDP2802284.1 glycoside hydrolase family 2 protein [Phreatobacter sp.]
MDPIRSEKDDDLVPLDAGWMLAIMEPGAAGSPAEADSRGDWIAAQVPGTAEAALIAAGRLVRGTPSGLHDRDVWYRCGFHAEGPATLCFEGLAGHADIFLDDEMVLEARSMFEARSCDITATGRHRLAIRFLALNPILAAAKGPRQRWRPQMIQPGSLRLVRTTPLGHMPGWSPDVAIVGPWQSVTLSRHNDGPRPVDLALAARLDGTEGVLDVSLCFDASPAAPVEILCGGHAQTLYPGTDGRLTARLVLPGVAPWWPHTHGEPTLYPVHLRIGGWLLDCGSVGFRSLALDRGPDGKGFALIVNGERVFCRGASWMPPDPVSPGGADPLPLLTLARDAGMNMIRISGTATPESRAFHVACDALGILVWHDLPFANFDYPGDDPAFRTAVEAETRSLLGRLQASPSLAVVCGGSEIAQQATMLGLRPDQAAMPLFEEVLAAVSAVVAPQAVYVPHTPWGGPLPFVTDEGVTHYFGVGAYCRPIEDARRADVRFASECLAFANVPAPATLAREGLASPQEAGWKDGVPRDAGASWDFEDVRDHYVRTLFAVDPVTLRREDPDRYLALGRAAPAELMEAVFAEWRRAGSRCGGGLVWFLNDMKPGAGWGVVDRLGQPKTTWHALKRAFRPIHLGITDEGLNGLGIHLTNETVSAKRVRLTLATYGEGPHPLVRAEKDMALAPRSQTSLSSFTLAGRFFDMAHAYRFGPLAHDATLARLVDPDTGDLLAEACHCVAGRAATPRDIGLSVRPVIQDGAPAVSITTERLARFVTVDDAGFRAADQGFSLAPGETRVVSLIGGHDDAAPRGVVAALNSYPVPYEVPA